MICYLLGVDHGLEKDFTHLSVQALPSMDHVQEKIMRDALAAKKLLEELAELYNVKARLDYLESEEQRERDAYHNGVLCDKPSLFRTNRPITRQVIDERMKRR